MADNQLVISSGGIVAASENNGLSDILKPLIREIHLFDSYVAGTTYLKDQSVLENITAGEKLILQREENKFDSNAIILYTEGKQKLGYVPEKDNVIFARLLDAGKIRSAKVKDIRKRGSFTQISIGIYLVDL